MALGPRGLGTGALAAGLACVPSLASLKDVPGSLEAPLAYQRSEGAGTGHVSWDVQGLTPPGGVHVCVFVHVPAQGSPAGPGGGVVGALDSPLASLAFNKQCSVWDPAGLWPAFAVIILQLGA